MSEIELSAGSDSQSSTPQPTLAQQLHQSKEECRRLRQEVDQLSDQAFLAWLSAVKLESSALAEMHTTLSWRVTKPLRLIRRVQIKIAEVGLGRTTQVAVADLRRRFVGRRR